MPFDYCYSSRVRALFKPVSDARAHHTFVPVITQFSPRSRTHQKTIFITKYNFPTICFLFIVLCFIGHYFCNVFGLFFIPHFSTSIKFEIDSRFNYIVLFLTLSFHRCCFLCESNCLKYKRNIDHGSRMKRKYQNINELWLKNNTDRVNRD